MNNQKLDLAVIIPVYNEEGAIEKVINKWNNELVKIDINFKIYVYNDGSKDNTLNLLKQLKRNYKNLIVFDKLNSGHGSTILQGYCENSHAEWIFQADSDDEIEPKLFQKLWRYRNNYDFIVGRRSERKSPLARSIISFVARLVVNIIYGKSVYDVNCPYRLMKVKRFKDCFFSVPKGSFAPNVIISGYAAWKKIKTVEVDVLFQPRTTGEISIKKIKLFKAAITCLWQTIIYRIILCPKTKINEPREI